MRYRTQVYTGRKSYSSHRNLSAEGLKGISQNNYCNIPDFLDTPTGRVVLYDEYGDYLPLMGGDWVLRSSGWAEHKPTGTKVKRVSTATPDYYKENGCGDMTIMVMVKVPEAIYA